MSMRTEQLRAVLARLEKSQARQTWQSVLYIGERDDVIAALKFYLEHGESTAT